MAVQLLDDYPWGTRQGNACSCCGRGQTEMRDPVTGEPRMERVVDFGISIDMEGFLMLCEQCVAEAAAALGFVDPRVRDQAVAELVDARVELEQARAERDEAKLIVRLIRDYDRNDTDSSVGTATFPADEHIEEAAPVEPVRKTKARTVKATT